MPIKRCPLGSLECALFIVAQRLLRLLSGKSSVATKIHSEEQKSNSKGQQTRGHTRQLVWPFLFSNRHVFKGDNYVKISTRCRSH
ncbi:hypothetical protein D9603_16310 [Pseudoalteromonas sp. PS5]|nr:hypothetical protein D9603_16310 [Pseudoalteromonas sp. PS5]